MTNPTDLEALAAKATPGPWAFDAVRGLIYHRPDPLTKYVIADLESSNDANGELIVALVNSLTALRTIAQDAAPVAWWFTRADGLYRVETKQPYYADARNVTPLYTHPPLAAQADAAVVTEGEKYRLMLLELLAVLHRDGGHRTQELGIDLSYDHAIQRIAEERATRPLPTDSARSDEDTGEDGI